MFVDEGHIEVLSLSINFRYEYYSMSGSGVKLVRIHSDTLDDSFDEVPAAQDFQFRINESEVSKEYSYTLKKGKKLPYTVNSQAFGRFLFCQKSIFYFFHFQE